MAGEDSIDFTFIPKISLRPSTSNAIKPVTKVASAASLTFSSDSTGDDGNQSNPFLFDEPQSTGRPSSEVTIFHHVCVFLIFMLFSISGDLPLQSIRAG